LTSCIASDIVNALANNFVTFFEKSRPDYRKQNQPMTHSHPTRKNSSTSALPGGAVNVSHARGNVTYSLLTVAFVELQFLPTHATPRSYIALELYALTTRLGFPGAAIHLPTS
jgi:hypothetical protein